MKQLRIDFPDYLAKEQEQDAQKHFSQTGKKAIKHAYIMKVDGEWAHFIINSKTQNYGFYGKANLFEVYQSLKEDYPDFKPRVILNEGLENYLRDCKKRDEAIKRRQLTIFNERD